MPPALFLSLPSCFAVGFMRPKNAGFPAAGVGMWWVGPVARSLYVFENPSGVFTNKACCLWIALFFFYVFHRLCVVFDVLTYMCLLTEPVEDWGKSSKLSDLFVGIISHFLHMFVNPQPVFCLPTYPTFTVTFTGLCEPKYQFICYEPIRCLFKGLFNLKKQQMLWFFLFCRRYQHILKCMVGLSLQRCSEVSVVASFQVCWLECIFICSQQTWLERLCPVSKKSQ